MAKWQPIETAPKTGEGIRVFGVFYLSSKPMLIGGPRIGIAFYDGRNWIAIHSSTSDRIIYKPTHWKPLGKEPKLNQQPAPCTQNKDIIL